MSIIIQRAKNAHISVDKIVLNECLVVFILGEQEITPSLEKRIRNLKIWNGWKNSTVEFSIVLVSDNLQHKDLVVSWYFCKYEDFTYTNDGPCTFILT